MHVSERALSDWCEQWLASPVAETLFVTGNLSLVTGVRLADGRDVVLKIRPAHPRLSGCTTVQQHLWQQGFPCPQPLAGPHPLDAPLPPAGPHPLHGYAVNAELHLPGGTELAPEADRARNFAGLLVEFIRLAPAAQDVADLTPAPAWMHWYHDFPGVWPPPDDRADDLNAVPETAWLDEIGARVRQRLTGLREGKLVVGHGDWESHNLRWQNGRPWAVHDWDSVVAEPETVITGVAAAMWPASMTSSGATIAESEAFLSAYQAARGTPFSEQQVEETWAAGLWVRSFNAKKFLLDGLDTLSLDEASERLRRAGA